MIPLGELFHHGSSTKNAIEASPLETRFADHLSRRRWTATPEDGRLIWRKDHFFGSSQVPMIFDGRRVIADWAFAAEEGTSSIVVVELDGHDFHERTLAQAMRDRSKDRTIQLRGHMVLRFTGHEVMSYGDRCVHDLERGLHVVQQRVLGTKV